MKVNIGGAHKEIRTLWREGSTIRLIDQRQLPHKLIITALENHVETAEAIRNMVMRGAGAIGVAGGYGMAQTAIEAQNLNIDDFKQYMAEAAQTLRYTRPTAANLFSSIDRCLKSVRGPTVQDMVLNILAEADSIAEDDLNASVKIGDYGEPLIEDGFNILTHCNAGALAFIDYGTALSPIRFAHESGKNIHVFVDETRPRCQGARLTAWELEQEGIPYSIIVDNAAGYYMRKGEIQIAIVGADRVARNGDVANKIGTYEKAVLAKENNIPFYVAAPRMTFDLDCKSGDDIEIEERDIDEVLWMWGVNENGDPTRVLIAERGSMARNPSFDITPAEYITGFITEKGILKPPYIKSIVNAFGTEADKPKQNE